jgi:hypothetical protein
MEASKETSMVAAYGHETVYTVLGAAARRRGAVGLFVQLVVSVATTTALLVAAPHWWSLAFLSGWSAAYAGWGLLVRVSESDEGPPATLVVTLKSIAALGTVLAVAGIIGVGLAIYSGNARGVKEPCGVNATSKYCRAIANPAPSQGLVK